MKKMASLIWVPLLLGSCFAINHKKNYFVAGQFELVEDEVGYYLEVEEISKSVFSSSNGINTVKDSVTGKYFSIEFRKGLGDETALIDLVNLKDENPRTKAIPASYIDDNGIKVIPRTPIEDFSDERYYCIIYQSSYLRFERSV